MSLETSCPCGSTQRYQVCCQPLHEGQTFAHNAEQLMRSRYSAFEKQKINYLVQTTALGQQAQLNQQAILQWSQQNTWQKLEVVNFNAKIDKTHAMVEFKAYYFDGQSDQVHHETSFFILHQENWYFLDPTLAHYPSMKQPCVCGSSKKFKACCAQFVIA